MVAISDELAIHAANGNRRGTMIFLTHHKCASTYMGSFLSELVQKNTLTWFRSHRGDGRPDSSADISYLSNADYKVVKDSITPKTIHIIRNPLNIIQSAYYSHIATHPLDGWPELAKQRDILKIVNAFEGILLTIAFCERQDFYDATPGPLAALRGWNFGDPRIITVRSEDLVGDPTAAIRSAMGEAADGYLWPDPQDYLFERFAGGRTPGEIDRTSHYRSGNPDQWRRELPAAAIAYIRGQFGDMLERFYPESLS